MTIYKAADMRRAETQAIFDEMDYLYTAEYLDLIDAFLDCEIDSGSADPVVAALSA